MCTAAKCNALRKGLLSVHIRVCVGLLVCAVLGICLNRAVGMHLGIPGYISLVGVLDWVDFGWKALSADERVRQKRSGR